MNRIQCYSIKHLFKHHHSYGYLIFSFTYKYSVLAQEKAKLGEIVANIYALRKFYGHMNIKHATLRATA